MKKLFEITELVSNTKDAVVLKVKPNSEMDLICLGCFNGDETMLRLTKGEDVTCTVWTKNGSHYSWHWGTHGYTLVSDSMEQRGLMILETIEHGFDIRVKTEEKFINADMAKTDHIHTIIFYGGSRESVCCHKDGSFIRYFKSVQEGVAFFASYGFATKCCGNGKWVISK